MLVPILRYPLTLCIQSCLLNVAHCLTTDRTGLKFQATRFLIKGYHRSTSGVRPQYLISQFLGGEFLLCPLTKEHDTDFEKKNTT